MRKRRSPKGLVSIEPVAPERAGFRWEQTGVGRYELKGPDVRKELEKPIERWRKFAKIKGGSPTDLQQALGDRADTLA